MQPHSITLVVSSSSESSDQDFDFTSTDTMPDVSVESGQSLKYYNNTWLLYTEYSMECKAQTTGSKRYQGPQT